MKRFPKPVPYYFANFFSILISLTPPKVLDFCARSLAFIFFYVFRLRRKVIIKNLNIAFGTEKSSQEKIRLGFLSYYHFILTVLEFLHYRNGDISKNTSIEGREEIDRVLESGQGAYIIAMHMSNWEASASVVAQQIKPVNVAVKKVGSSSLDSFVNELRRRNGMFSIERKSRGDAIRSMRKFLSKGELVAVILDQFRPGEPYLDFFGTPASTNTSFAGIWSLIKAPVFIAYSVRTKFGHHKLYFKKQLTMQTSGKPKEDVLTNSQYLNRVIEECIRKCPEQYFWLHDRWKVSKD